MNYQKNCLFLFFLFLTCTISCSKEATIQGEILWVNKEKVSCTGLIEQTCYLVQESEILGTDWEFFYDAIEGFDNQYEEGFIYKLEVEIETIENPPADASSLKYTLIKILSKEE